MRTCSALFRLEIATCRIGALDRHLDGQREENLENAQKQMAATVTHIQAFLNVLLMSRLRISLRRRGDRLAVKKKIVQLLFHSTSLTPRSLLRSVKLPNFLADKFEAEEAAFATQRERMKSIAAHPKKHYVNASRIASACGMNAGETSVTCAQKACFRVFSWGILRHNALDKRVA
jgi:hypothetical protein